MFSSRMAVLPGEGRKRQHILWQILHGVPSQAMHFPGLPVYPRAVGGRGDYLSRVSPHLFLRPDRYQLAVLYLLTTKDALWQRIAPAIRAGQIDYSAVRQGDAKMIQTILRNAQYPEHGVPTSPFPIPDEEYARCIELLNTLEIGDPIKRDCITGAST